ncbi:MAG: hypothetical protein ETSY1_36750 [Candidatus Entotheonella factor]|uniref:Uncharacterized protein n=1 Tax=Entotheonella factor TaxID=1429438 RepID=W4L7I5_ENTF1|nr:hypothetical protein [Candidatus Entotheonella palauensis]ETW94007.1 MAG: hypothetical protein ETSY1_36750 [Candidatus Entotheonella factor]
MKKWWSGSDISVLEREIRSRSAAEVQRALAKLHGKPSATCGRVYKHKDEEQMDMCRQCSSFSLALFQVIKDRPDLIFRR